MSTPSPTVSAAEAAPAAPIGRYRWVVVGLLFTAMIVNYVDRQTLGFLKGDLSKEYGWTETNYADLVFWFQATYAVSYIIWGRIMDRIGARWGFGLAFLIWQIGHIATAGAHSLSHFVMSRLVLGAGEGGAFPGGIKAMTEWFPKKERAFATGLFNAGTNIGAIVTPLVIPMVALAWGWRACFIVTGIAGLLWLPIWLFVYRRPRENPRVSAAELAHIESDPADPVEKVPWVRLLRYRETWAYALGKVLDRPDLVDVPLLAAGLPGQAPRPGPEDLRPAGGGDLSDERRGQRRRRLVLVADDQAWLEHQPGAQDRHAGLRPAGGASSLRGHGLEPLGGGDDHRRGHGRAPGLFGQPLHPARRCLSALRRRVRDRHRRHAGRGRGMAMSKYAGYVLEKIGSYTPIFVLAASAYLVALLVIHILSPRLEPVEL